MTAEITINTIANIDDRLAVTCDVVGDISTGLILSCKNKVGQWKLLFAGRPMLSVPNSRKGIVIKPIGKAQTLTDNDVLFVA